MSYAKTGIQQNLLLTRDCGEYEESSASGDYTAVQCHTDTAASHSQLGNTGLEECTAEVTFLEGMCFLEESVCLVGIGKVGRSNNHIFYLRPVQRNHEPQPRCMAGVRDRCLQRVLCPYRYALQLDDDILLLAKEDAMGKALQDLSLKQRGRASKKE